MSENTTLSGTPDGGSEQPTAGESGGTPGVDEGAAASEPVPAAGDAPPSASVGMFRPTMHDGSSASETGDRTVPVRPLEMQAADPTSGEIAPFDGPDAAADQDLILGPPVGEEAGNGFDPVPEVSDATTAPALAANLIDGTGLFGDRAALWSGDPSEVGTSYGAGSSHAAIYLCDETSLFGQEAPDLAS